MNTAVKTIYLKDYQAPAFRVVHTELQIDIGETGTTVEASLELERNRDVSVDQPLRLHGVDLELQWLKLNDTVLTADQWQQDGEELIIKQVPEGRFFLYSSVIIHPETNTALEGLYQSGSMFCTQCEAEGFRKITFYPDRPDVMAVFKTTIRADKQRYPVLLANGNPVDSGDLPDGRHFVTWEDPFPKPSYLFATVAGNLACKKDTFVTMSGRTIDLRIYVEAHDLEKTDHAMDSLKRSMRWDEEVFGREYDLDIFMIVAVSHFNMGAMENKGLNIFNTSCVLAHPDTTTDAGFQRVESVIAHEYFHNWSGNRVTCRDWFQLSLKEGLTVFRDQQFSADMLSASVQRIEDVNMLKTWQFAEDAGPLSHPVRPESFVEINNFYTATVYEKGAEIVRMLHTVLGKEKFRKGTDLYFSRHDGQAVTVEDFVKALGDANGVSLDAFMQWYRQPGTPTLHVHGEYDAEKKTYSLTLRQQLPQIAGFPTPQPLPVPVRMALLGADGHELALMQSDHEESGLIESGLIKKDITEKTVLLEELEQTFVFENIAERPIPSVLRNFSAPVRVEQLLSLEEKLFLLQHDRNGFNRWLVAQDILIADLLRLAVDSRAGKNLQPNPHILSVLTMLLPELAQRDMALAAKLLQLPSLTVLMDAMTQPDPDALHMARQGMRHALTLGLEGWLLAQCEQDDEAPYAYDADAIARRSLRNTALSLLVSFNEEYHALAVRQFSSSQHMTGQAAALQALVHGNSHLAESCLSEFAARWQHEALVMDQWFAMQASAPLATTIERVNLLVQHVDFHWNNPNRVRALIGQFANQNPLAFHQKDGKGYAVLFDAVKMLDGINPQIAARLLGALGTWQRFDKERCQLIHAELQSLAVSKISPDVTETVQRLLSAVSQ